MFCPYCGAQLPAEALFCNRCGRHLELLPPQESASLASPSHPAVSGLAGPVAQQQDGLYSSPSGFQYPQTDPGLSASPILLPFASSLPTMYETAASASSRGVASSPELPSVQAPRQQGRRRLWMVLSSIVVVLLLLAAWGGFTYVNRSTPQKTLATLSTALKSQDFEAVYNQFSHTLKSHLGPEQAWALSQQAHYKSLGGLTNSTVSNVSEKGSSASGLVTLTLRNY
jgi:uncharacterized membrane protein YvbJ